MHVLYIKSENYSRARESLRSRRSRELFESARRKGMRKKSARATHASQCHVYVYILCFTLWPLYLRYCTLLSMKISQYIRTHSYVRPIYIRIVRLVRQKSAHLTFYLVVHSIRSDHNEQYKQQNLICFFFSGFVKPKHWTKDEWPYTVNCWNKKKTPIAQNLNKNEFENITKRETKKALNR